MALKTVIIYLVCLLAWTHHTQAMDTKPRIAIITMATREYSFLFLSLKNKWMYAKAHDYDLTVDYDVATPRGPVWHKLHMVEDVLNANKHDWIWWIDFDTLVTNMTIKLEDIIAEALQKVDKPDEVDMLLTADCFPLNAGSMLMRATPRLQTYIDAIRAYGVANNKLNEQDCLRNYISDQNLVAKGKVVMIPQWKINAFPSEIGCYDKDRRGWEQGMFVIHFAGAWAHVKVDDAAGVLMKRYQHYVHHYQKPDVVDRPKIEVRRSDTYYDDMHLHVHA